MSKDSRLYAKFTLDFPDHPKILCLSVEAKWALVDLTIYSRRHLTDGFISKPVALAKHGASVCSELASNDAHHPSLIEVDDGYIIHDFAAHQSTKAEIEALTEKRKEAGRKGGKARAKQVLKQTASKTKPETETETGNYYVVTEDAHAASSASPTSSSPATPSTPYPADFVEWWEHYPRKTGKGAAAKAYAKARRTVTADELLAAVHRYRADPNLPPPEFVPHASTWLNGGRWADGPLPARAPDRSQHQDPTRSGWDQLKSTHLPQIGA